MGIKVKDTGGGDFKKVPQGTHMAACNMVVDLGTQKTEYMGQEKHVHQIYIRWEVPSERIEYEIDGEKKEGPLCIGRTYTASLSEKSNLRKDLQGWRNKAFSDEELQGFDIESILGTCCQIVVTHREANNNTYANVTSIAGWPKSIERISPENEPIYYDAENSEQYDQLPNWIKDKLGEERDSTNVEDSGDDSENPDDDIPFAFLLPLIGAGYLASQMVTTTGVV